jgi:hypothetical protein
MRKVRETAKQVDLESAICDVADMANVCLTVFDVMQKNERSTAEMDVSAKQAAEGLAYWRDIASFSVLHLKVMAEELKRQYYTSVE